MKEIPISYRALAALISAFSLLMVTVVPIASGARTYSPSLLLDWLGVVAVVWAAAIAAETVTEMERARKAELTPVFDIVVRRSFDQGTPSLELTVTNLGKGPAAGVKAWAVAASSGDDFSEIEHLTEISPVFLPSASETFALITYWTSIVMGQTEGCDLIVHLRYRDALGDTVVRRVGFAIGSLVKDIRIVEPPPVTPLELTHCRHWGA